MNYQSNDENDILNTINLLNYPTANDIIGVAGILIILLLGGIIVKEY